MTSKYQIQKKTNPNPNLSENEIHGDGNFEMSASNFGQIFGISYSSSR